MRKYFILITLLSSFCLFVNAQTDDQEVWRKVESLKKELKIAKGETKINCLNRLAEHYFGIWDEDDKFRDTACIFSNRAYEEATKIKYKQGIAFALANRALCAMSLTDNDRNNNDKETAYANAYKEAKIAIKYAEDLNNNYIIGNVYDNLRWMEKWRGTPDKLKTNIENAILYFEKVKSNDFKTAYKPLVVINCPSCNGTENLLGWLYLELSRTQAQFNITMKEQIEKAIYYYQRSGSRSGLAGAYMSYGMLLAITKDLEAGIEYLKKAVVGFHEDNSNRSELQALTELCNSYWALGDFENGLEYGKRSVQIAETLLKLKDAGDADTLRLGQSYFRMGRFYTIAGDYENCLYCSEEGTFLLP
jgi:tetratricopeptide (TPR) repeat protein